MNSPACRRDLLQLTLLIGIYFCLGLGAHAYLVPSEARYIEIPRQMLATGDWLTPRINGVPYFEKPPLFYWLQASAMGLLGTGEFAGRIVTAALMTLTCLLTYVTGSMLYGRNTGLLAAGVLATSLMGFGLAHVAMLDVPVSLFITACMTCFIAAQKTQNRNFYLLMYVASALAMLSKGLIGIVIPGLVIGAWIALTRQWRTLREVHIIPGLIIFLLIAAPWHVLMAERHPDFLSFYFIHEHFTRYLTDEHKRTAPWWFFIAVTPVGLLPWTGLLFSLPHRGRAGVGALWREFYPLRSPPNLPPNGGGVTLFLTLWILLPLIFFSASHSKLISYIFPIFPPLAILCGRVLADEINAKNLRLNAIGIILLLSAALIAAPLLPTLPGKAGLKMAALSAITFPMLVPIALSLLWLAYTLIKNASVKAHITALMLVGAAIGFTANYAVAALDTAGTKPLASMLREQLYDGDMVAAYGTYWQDLPVYLNRNIAVVDWRGELAFGVEHYPDTQKWMIKADEFWKRCEVAQRGVYVFIGADGFKTLPEHKDCELHIIAEYGKTLLLEKTQ